MRLGLVSGYSGPKMNETMQVILEAERLGFDSVWTGEAWGSDVVSFLAFVGARTSTIKLGAGILQMQARTPAMTAMMTPMMTSNPTKAQGSNFVRALLPKPRAFRIPSL